MGSSQAYNSKIWDMGTRFKRIQKQGRRKEGREYHYVLRILSANHIEYVKN